MKMKIGNGNRDDSFSIYLRTCKETEIEKTKWMDENIVKDKTKYKYAMECGQDEMVFLDTKIVATPITGKKYLF